NVLNDKNKFHQIMSKMKNYSILMDLNNILTIVENAELFEKSIEYLNSDVPDEWGFIKKKEIREIVFKVLNEKSKNAYFKIIDYGKHNYDGVKQTINNTSKQERDIKLILVSILTLKKQSVLISLVFLMI
ncbi:hypothetical protein ACM15T_001758, partial [Campylobacter jejuni]